MRTKKNKAAIPALAGGESAPKETPISPNLPDANEPKPDRISFNVTDDGAPDWNRMLPKTKEQLTKLLKNKAVQKELGISEEVAASVAKMEFGEEEANALLDLIANINTIGASKIYKIPSEITAKAFAFSPDHRKKINPPMMRVMNKWGPMLLKTWKDEIGLGIILFAVINAQIRLMHMLEDQRKKNGPQPREKVTPISTPAKASEPEAPAAPAPANIGGDKSEGADVLDNVGFNL